MSKIKLQQLKTPPSVEVTTRIQHYGDYSNSDQHMRINPRRGDVVNTIIHEKLHHNFPDMEHDKIYENADKIESKMTLPEMAREIMNVHVASQSEQNKKTLKSNIIEVPRIISENNKG